LNGGKNQLQHSYRCNKENLIPIELTPQQVNQRNEIIKELTPTGPFSIILLFTRKE